LKILFPGTLSKTLEKGVSEMKKAKRILGRVLLMVLVFSMLLAAGSFGQDKITLRYWMQTETIINEASRELIAEYQKANPGVQIIMTNAPHAEHVTRIYVALAGGVGPDFFVFPDREIPRLMQAKGLANINYEGYGVASLNELKDGFTPGALNSYVDNDRLYAIPAWMAVYSWVINKDHFNEVGINPDKDYPRTWDDVISAGKKLKVVENGRMVREPLTFPFNMSGAWYVLGYEPILAQYGGSILNEDHTEAAINSSAGIKALQLWYDMVYKHKIISLERANEHFDMEFANGTISMWFGANWQAPSFTRYNPAIEGHFKIIPFPVVSGGKRTVETSTWCYMLNSGSERQAEASRFLAYVMSRGGWWLGKTGFILPVKGIAESPEAKAMPFADVWLEDVKYSQPILIDLHFAEIAKVIVRAVEKSLFTGVSPKEALDVAAQEINEIKKR